ncbi:hypothetical protein Hanom_Chr15g01402211 [Helianthus anomalus]
MLQTKRDAKSREVQSTGKATLYFCVKDSLLAAVSIIYQHSSIQCLKDSTV